MWGSFFVFLCIDLHVPSDNYIIKANRNYCQNYKYKTQVVKKGMILYIISFLSLPHSCFLSFALCHLLLCPFPSLSKLFVGSSLSLSFCFFTFSIHSSSPSSQFVSPHSFFFPRPSLSPPTGSSRRAQSDAMVVIGCPLPQIRSQLALGVLWRLPITPHPIDQGLTPERVEDRQVRRG